jgi:hypothetical protein
VYASRGGFRDAVKRVRLLSAHPYSDDAWIVFDQFPHGFTPEAPHFGQIANTEMLLEGRILNQHGNPQSTKIGPDSREQVFSS